MIILSPGLVVAPAGDLPLSYPRVGWQSQVTIGNLTADSEATGFPVTNLANPSTANWWKSGSTVEQLVTVSGLSEQTDYVGIPNHNFGSGRVEVSVEAITGEPGAVWEQVHPGLAPANDAPLMLCFAAGFYVGVRLRLVPDAVPPQATGLYVGESLVLQRSLQAGFTPIGDAREDEFVGGWAISGDYLGAIVEGASSSNTAQIKALDPTWYRNEMRPWVLAANQGAPFFFAWDPLHHPDEIGFCIFAGPVKPVINYLGGKEIDISIPMQGVAL